MSHVGVQNIDQMLLRGSWFRLWLFIPLSTLLLTQSKALIIRDFHKNIVFVSIATNELSYYQYTGHCFLEPIFFQALKIKLTEYVSRGYILPSFILIQFLLLIFQIFCYFFTFIPSLLTFRKAMQAYMIIILTYQITLCYWLVQLDYFQLYDFFVSEGYSTVRLP